MTIQENISEMFKAGAHFGFVRSRRHPTTKPFIFGVKNRIEIFDLEKTEPLLLKAEDVVTKLAAEGKTILFCGGKSEARGAVRRAALSVDMPFVAGRWVGGTFSNFESIRRRVQKYLDLTDKREKGELSKYTKKERLLIDREIAKLELLFSGLIPMTKIPDAIFVIDPKKEHIAVAEAHKMGVPVIALCGSDCNLKEVNYAIVGNDSSVSSVQFFVDRIIAAYKNGYAQKRAVK